MKSVVQNVLRDPLQVPPKASLRRRPPAGSLLHCLLLCLCLCLVLTGCAGTRSAGSSLGTAAGKNSAVVGGYGTAWTIFPGYLVTNFHVVHPHYASRPADADVPDPTDPDNPVLQQARQNDIFVSYQGHVQRAQIVAADMFYDLCLLTVPDTRHLPPALRLSSQPLRLGQHLSHVGFPNPASYGFVPKFLEGSVSAKLRYEHGPLSGTNSQIMTFLFEESSFYQSPRYPLSYIMTTVPAVSGCSGGPAFADDGTVVGIFGAAPVESKSRPLRVSFVIPASWVQRFAATALANRRTPIAQAARAQARSWLQGTGRVSVAPEDSVALVATLTPQASSTLREDLHKTFVRIARGFDLPAESVAP